MALWLSKFSLVKYDFIWPDWCTDYFIYPTEFIPFIRGDIQDSHSSRNKKPTQPTQPTQPNWPQPNPTKLTQPNQAAHATQPNENIQNVQFTWEESTTATPSPEAPVKLLPQITKCLADSDVNIRLLDFKSWLVGCCQEYPP